MENRRTFLQAAVGAAAASRSILGANDRVQMGIIGTGMRGGQVHESFIRNKDVAFIAACDVAKSRLDQFATKAGGKMSTTTEFKKILDNKDIDAVLITTPDHWHAPIMMAACEAGKDVYVEKPVSNAIEPCLKMIEWARKYNRVVQVGTQQRSWQHFQDCAKMVKDGVIGKINHCVLLFPSTPMAQPVDQPEAPPADLDWETFQGPAKHVQYVQRRQRSWRGYWDYGGGSITDWGVHLTDIMNWYMDYDKKAPALTSASAVYVGINPSEANEKAPDTYSVTWKCDGWVGTFMNATVPSRDPQYPGMSDNYGNYFYGDKGVMLVNRYGYEIFPVRQSRIPRANTPGSMAPPPPAAIEAKRVMDPTGMTEAPDTPFGSATVRHTRNFLDCVKSRQRPISDIEIGFNSTLPTLLAVQAIRQGKGITWDGKTAKAV